MRRALFLVLAALLLAGCAKAPAPIPTAAVPASPFHGLGRLAVVRSGQLSVLDGETDATHQVADQAGMPAWSADGQWLSFLQGENDRRVVDTATWRVREIAGVPGPVTGLAWAPRGHALAVTTADSMYLLDDPGSGRARLLLKRTDGQAPGGLLWAPDGSRIAYLTTAENRTEVLNVVRVSDGQTMAWYRAEGSAIELAAWRPDSGGILFWVRPGHCNSCAVDGLPLLSLPVGAAEPVTLPVTLLHRGWLNWSGGELLLVRGGGRIAWDDKQLAICNVTTGRCRDLPQPETAVSLDPALSPDGSRVAMVQAERRPGKWGFDAPGQAAAWQETRQLWLVSPDGSGGYGVPAAGSGISNPTWAADGRHLLYVAQGTLMVIDLNTHDAQPVVALDKAEPFGYYGQTNYSYQFAYHR